MCPFRSHSFRKVKDGQFDLNLNQRSKHIESAQQQLTNLANNECIVPNTLFSESLVISWHRYL